MLSVRVSKLFMITKRLSSFTTLKRRYRRGMLLGCCCSQVFPFWQTSSCIPVKSRSDIRPRIGKEQTSDGIIKITGLHSTARCRHWTRKSRVYPTVVKFTFKTAKSELYALNHTHTMTYCKLTVRPMGAGQFEKCYGHRDCDRRDVL